MGMSELGSWDPLNLASTIEIFSTAPFRWWVSGGRALELHLGRSWREHDDTDVSLVRRDCPALRRLLAGWEIYIAAAGRLTPWRGEEPKEERHENNLCAAEARPPTGRSM